MEPVTLSIGTSNPVNICYGLPLFPIATPRVGIVGSARPIKLLDISATIFITRLKVSAYAEYAFGACGPAVAFLFPDVQMQRSNEGGKGKLALTFTSGQQLEAGAYIGLSVGAGVNLALQLYRPSVWYQPWKFSWNDAFSASFSASVDFLGLLVELIKYLLGRNSASSFKKDNGNTLVDALPGIQSYIFLDSGNVPRLERELTAAPELVLPVNLVNFIPVLKTLNEKFSKIGGELSVGPSFHIALPLTFSMASFTVEGGLQGVNSATYDSLTYSGDTVTATGNTLFNEQVTPAKLTTNVSYATGFALGISVHFRVTVAKMFNFEVNSPSLDLTKLLFGQSQSSPVISMQRSVATGVQNNCLLVPNMTLYIGTSSGDEPQTGDPVKGHVQLSSNYPGPTAPGNVSLAIEPHVEGFPTSTTIANGSRFSESFSFTFPNQCMLTGNPENPLETEPPGPTRSLQTYSLKATIPYLSGNPCSEYQVTVPFNVNSRYIRVQRARSFAVAASAPPWDPLASAYLNVQTGLGFAAIACWFPYLYGESPSPIPITFTLLDENRVPHASSTVNLSINGTSILLAPTATVLVTPLTGQTDFGNLLILWNSKGTSNEYTNRFFLVADAGCSYGRTEFWLDVNGWS